MADHRRTFAEWPPHSHSRPEHGPQLGVVVLVVVVAAVAAAGVVVAAAVPLVHPCGT